MIAPHAEERREQVVFWRDDGATYREIAEVMNLTRERIRQLYYRGAREAELCTIRQPLCFCRRHACAGFLGCNCPKPEPTK